MSGRPERLPDQSRSLTSFATPGAAADRYLAAVSGDLTAAGAANRDSLVAAARILEDTIAADGIVHVFGSGHSQLLAMELSGRAGGLAGVNVIYDRAFGAAESVEGYAETLLREVVFARSDCLIVISTSGRNAAPVEMALLGRRADLAIIAVTALELSRSATPHHPSGKRLFEIADAVLDTATRPGDAAVEIAGVAVLTGPTSTVIGAALLHAAVASAVEALSRRGVEPPILRSNNVEGGREYNAALRDRYAGRVHTPI